MLSGGCRLNREIPAMTKPSPFILPPDQRPPQGRHPDAPKTPEPYVATEELVTAVNLAIYLRRPLLLEGDAGCGKSRLARHVAYELGLPLYEWFVRSTSRAQDGLYTYDSILRLHDVHLRQFGARPDERRWLGHRMRAHVGDDALQFTGAEIGYPAREVPTLQRGGELPPPDGDADLEGVDLTAFVVPACLTCGGMLKPDVVFYGESVPRARLEAALAQLRRSDALLVVGSSLMVYSGLRFARMAAEAGLAVAALNRGRTRADDLLTLKIEADCVPVLAALVDAGA